MPSSISARARSATRCCARRRRCPSRGEPADAWRDPSALGSRAARRRDEEPSGRLLSRAVRGTLVPTARRPEPARSRHRQGGAMIYHMVLLKFRKGIAQKDLDQTFKDLAALRGKIPGLSSFTGGPYRSPEGLNKGWTHGFCMTFTDARARDEYL